MASTSGTGKGGNAKGAGHPVPKMKTKPYEKQMRHLHGELVAMQEWVKSSGAKIIVVFEGRDTAGKGGTIKRITERVSPRVFRVVALPAPTDRQKSQMYLQRYVEHFPAAGEVIIFDRSWYNRAGVERVMGFCSEDQYQVFMRQAPAFERMLVESGTTVTKLWFSVTQQEQRTRFAIRQLDPVRRWKLSPMDLESLDRWEAYTAAKEAMFEFTDKKYAPWLTIKSNDKKRGRINALRAFLNQFEYEGKDTSVVFPPDEAIVKRARHAEGD
jgi:polyphosphate kinase 2